MHNLFWGCDIHYSKRLLLQVFTPFDTYRHKQGLSTDKYERINKNIEDIMRYVHTANEQILSAMNVLNSDRKDLIQNEL